MVDGLKQSKYCKYSEPLIILSYKWKAHPAKGHIPIFVYSPGGICSVKKMVGKQWKHVDAIKQYTNVVLVDKI